MSASQVGLLVAFDFWPYTVSWWWKRVSGSVDEENFSLGLLLPEGLPVNVLGGAGGISWLCQLISHSIMGRNEPPWTHYVYRFGFRKCQAWVTFLCWRFA